ncbi:MAG TPA: universal stress protein [Candidatus Binatia bacterium]
MYSKILVPLDGSDLSEGILPFARTIAKAFGIPLELLHVIDPETIEASSSASEGRYFFAAEAEIKKARTSYLDEAVRNYLPSLTVRSSVETGNPPELIVDHAKEHPETLVAMATHGRSGVQRWFMGSVAEKVLHTCSNPLLLVRTAGKAKSNDAVLKTIIVPLDGSPLAELVLPHAAAMAKAMKLQVVLVRVYFVPTEGYVGEGYVPDIEPLLEILRNDAKEYLEDKMRSLKAQGVEKISYELPEGSAAGKIIDLSRETPDNLVAMSTHGRSGIGRWVLGNVTDRVVRHCGDPVLVIRAPRQGA